ncbi:BnaC09g38570D [Brassica napus]|uniref:BnaC09g38570D protein n=1 Tax=Brassica napus TaxID=3708 RepID=A0A078FM42_BRANA|nr:BnaC09g38570D [Brassica napus]
MAAELSRSRALYLRRVSISDARNPSLHFSLNLRRNPSPELSLYLRREICLGSVLFQCIVSGLYLDLVSICKHLYIMRTGLKTTRLVELDALSSQAHSLPLFLSLFKMAKDVSIELEYVYGTTWTPEEVMCFFELYAKERRKGNRTTSMNKIGKQNIIEAFEERFKKGYLDWSVFKNKYYTSRKKYTKFRKLIKNRTGLGFDSMGRVDMSDDWWSEREKECSGIRRSIWREEFNMDMFEEEFRAIVVTGAEGWSAQHGEASLSSRVGVDDGDEADSQPAAETQAAAETETQPQAQTQTQRQTQTHSGSSRGKKKRKEKDMVVEACDKRTEALMVKNKIAERMLERSPQRQEASSVENVLEIMYTLPGVREWSPLYEAAMEHLIDSEGSRRAFITMKTEEAKIKFLELRTKIKRDYEA